MSEVLISSRVASLGAYVSALKHRARTLESLPLIRDGIVGLLSYSLQVSHSQPSVVFVGGNGGANPVCVLEYSAQWATTKPD